MAQGGKSFNDRMKSAEVREKVLDAMLMVYNGKEKKLTQKQWELTLRMGTTILPRLNEISGPDGEPIPLLNFVKKNVRHSNNPREDSETE